MLVAYSLMPQVNLIRTCEMPYVRRYKSYSKPLVRLGLERCRPLLSSDSQVDDDRHSRRVSSESFVSQGETLRTTEASAYHLNLLLLASKDRR